MTVTLVEHYDPDWPNWFATLRARFETKLLGHVVTIEHVGSTSVPGMTAKPIIDMDIVIEDGQFEKAKSLLDELGYYHQGDLGIQGRDAFELSDPDLKASIPPHHPYVCPETGDELRRHLAFRDFLRQSPDYVRRLSDLKWELALRYENDRQAYIDGKEALCKEIREKAIGSDLDHEKLDHEDHEEHEGEAEETAGATGSETM